MDGLVDVNTTRVMLSYWHIQPVHLIKLNPHIVPTLIKTFFPTVLVRNTIAACNRMPGSYPQAVQVPHTPAQQFLICRRLVRSPSFSLSSPRYTLFSLITGSSLVLNLIWISLGLLNCVLFSKRIYHFRCLPSLLFLRLLLLLLLPWLLITPAIAVPNGWVTWNVTIVLFVLLVGTCSVRWTLGVMSARLVDWFC